jgi:DNA-binding NtrC family response regulator
MFRKDETMIGVENARTGLKPVTDRSLMTPFTAGDYCQRGRVLVMDDQQNMLDIVEKFLDHLGYESEGVPDGETAILRYTQAMDEGTPFDLVLMDISIPNGMGANSTMKELRKHDPKASVIVMSGHCTHPLLNNPRQAGFLSSLAKPFTLAQLERSLSSVRSCARPGSCDKAHHIDRKRS